MRIAKPLDWYICEDQYGYTRLCKLKVVYQNLSHGHSNLIQLIVMGK